MRGSARNGVVTGLVAVLMLTAASGCATDQLSASMPEVAVPALDGGEVDFGELQGQDVLVWFWAPW